MVLRYILILLVALSSVSCAELTKQPAPARDQVTQLPPPKLVAPPPPPVLKSEEIKADPLDGITISVDAVNETFSSVLYMVAADTGLNLIISPDVDITRPFTLTVKNMPARQALDTIADNAGIYYSIDGNVLNIRQVVTKTFKIQYINTTTDQTSIIGGDIFGASSTDKQFIQGNYTVNYTTDASKSNVQDQIIGHIKSIIFPDEATTAGTGQQQGTSGQTAAQNPLQALTGQSGTQQTQSTGQQSQSSSKTSSSASASSSTAGKSNSLTADSYAKGAEGYYFNRLTGLLTVTTTPPKMKVLSDFLKNILKELNKQVLIEAKLVEVTLTDSSAYGINWSNMVFGNAANLTLGYNGSTLMSGSSSLSPVGTITNSKDMGDVFAFMASQGHVETLSNPRLRVMNGQSAMISTGKLMPYWEMSSSTDTDTNTTTVDYTRVMVLDGVMLGVTPFIRDDGTVTLNIVPISSHVEDEKKMTRATSSGGTEVVASYPVVNMKEAGTVLNMNSGDTVIMGGLISNNDQTTEYKVPFLSEIPYLGAAFRSKSTVKEKRELVIFLTTTIING